MKGGGWSTILTEIAAGHGINYEGASGSLNLDQYGDPLSGYAIWGIDSNNKIQTVAYFSGATVIQLLGGAPPAPTAPPQPLSPSFAPMAVPAREWGIA